MGVNGTPIGRGDVTSSPVTAPPAASPGALGPWEGGDDGPVGTTLNSSAAVEFTLTGASGSPSGAGDGSNGAVESLNMLPNVIKDAKVRGVEGRRQCWRAVQGQLSLDASCLEPD